MQFVKRAFQILPLAISIATAQLSLAHGSCEGVFIKVLAETTGKGDWITVHIDGTQVVGQIRSSVQAPGGNGEALHVIRLENGEFMEGVLSSRITARFTVHPVEMQQSVLVLVSAGNGMGSMARGTLVGSEARDTSTRSSSRFSPPEKSAVRLEISGDVQLFDEVQIFRSTPATAAFSFAPYESSNPMRSLDAVPVQIVGERSDIHGTYLAIQHRDGSLEAVSLPSLFDTTDSFYIGKQATVQLPSSGDRFGGVAYSSVVGTIVAKREVRGAAPEFVIRLPDGKHIVRERSYVRFQ